MNGRRAFTLIELLIVIAIIAILALIAVPNFLEAQVRAKTARAQADMRTVDVALGVYCVDWGRYPPPKTNQGWFFSRFRLTTPVAYLSTGDTLIDVFGAPLSENVESGPFYSQRLPAFIRYYVFNNQGNCTNANADATAYYVLAGNGPDRERYPHVGARISRSDVDEGDFQDILNQLYNPTNGTLSVGEVLRFGPGPSQAQRISGIVSQGW